MTTHLMFDGRLQVYRRGTGKTWQCAARVGEQRFRSTTKESDLDRAKDIAEGWYLELRGKLRNGEIVKKEHTFGEAWDRYLSEMRVLTIGERSPIYIEVMVFRMSRHALPFFREKPLPEINRGLVQAYRARRAEETIRAKGKPPARSTMTQEVVHIRQVLKWAEGMGWIPFVPNLTPPYKTQGKKGHRAWFSKEEYVQLYKATARRIEDCPRPGWESHYEDMHDYVLLMGNSGLRPDEAARLEIRDPKIEVDPSTRQTILVIDVRGKVGTGYCKTMPGAVHPFRRLVARRTEELRALGLTDEEIAKRLPTTRLFRKFDRAMFNEILKEEGLKTDREGLPRTAYSLRHTYISLRLMDGADVYQVANNCRTSVKMIEDHYAIHIKNRIDAGAINVRRPKIKVSPPKSRASRKDAASGTLPGSADHDAADEASAA